MPRINPIAVECVMALIRFAVSLFALSLLGLALSLSSAQSRQHSRTGDAAVFIDR